MSVHLVIGYGPAGAATARRLVDLGRAVRVVSRSSRQPEEGIEHVALDVTETERLVSAARGAVAIYNCACPPYPRWARDWPALAASVCAAAEASGAVLVMLSNLYGYGPVDTAMTEDLPLAATSVKGRVRAEVWQSVLDRHERGYLRAVEARASDFFGPGVTEGGHLASRMIPQLLRGRPAWVLGDPDVPHSWTFLPDVANTLIRLAQEEPALGRAWHVPTAPPLAMRTMVDKLARQAGVRPIPVRQIPRGLLRTVALFSPMVRELQEVRYQFDCPFVVDSRQYSERFHEEATPVDEQVRATLGWWAK